MVQVIGGLLAVSYCIPNLFKSVLFPCAEEIDARLGRSFAMLA